MADPSPKGYPVRRDIRPVFETLVVILDAVISLQPEIEAVMRSCLASGPKDALLARKAGRLTSTLIALVERVESLPASGIVDEARGLLAYHHRLLSETVKFGYSAGAIFNPHTSRRFSDDLGQPAARLRRLRGLVGSYLSDTDPTTESSRLARTVDNVLWLASIQAGTLRPDLRWSDLAAILRAAVDAIDPALQPASHVKMTLTRPGGTIWGDPTLLSQAVANILDNALRHNPPGTRATLTVTADAARITISVRDDGGGLRAGVADAIARATTRGILPTEIGTGISSAIGLVAVHGGTLSYPATRYGTCCTIRLPLDRR